MNKNLKIGLILGGSAILIGTIIYLSSRTPDDKPVVSGDGEEKKTFDEPEKDTSSTVKNKPKVSRPKSSKQNTKGGAKQIPSETATTTESEKPSLPPTLKDSTKLKDYRVSYVLSKVENPSILKGKYIASGNDDVALMNKNGSTAYKLKKDTTIGKYVDSSLTPKGDYLVKVQMNNGHIYMANANNLKFI